MSKTLEFFFDFVSPTAYLAQAIAPDVAKRAGAQLVYRPMFLGGVMQATGNRPPGMVAAKGAYLGQDLARCSKRHGLTLNFNPHFPMNTRPLTRATLGLEGDEQVRFMDAAWKHCWGIESPMNPSDEGELRKFCEAEGFDANKIVAMGSDSELKDKLKANTEEAVARGAFGAPTFFVGEEMFFGHDRLDYAEEALKS